MSGEVLISAENVGKKFCKDLKRSLWYGAKDLVNNVTGSERSVELRKDEFWAVKEINFEVRRGECLGLIGHNGAGKSTLLKMLNGLLRPDTGKITMHGRVGALIELGAGFNPILTGRENIFNNAAILGFTKKETEAKLKDIIAFSEIEEFLDMPVQNYSSGMRVRLGFAVAAQMEPDILLVDEVLAVGDIGFVLKCFNQMDKILPKTAMIFVSHNMPQVSRMCTKILLMDKGQELVYTDSIAQGITSYYERFSTKIGNFSGEGKARISRISVSSDGNAFDNNDNIVVEANKNLVLEVELESEEALNYPSLYLAFYDKEQRNFAEASNFYEQMQIDTAQGKIIFKATIDKVNFNQGRYSITIGMTHKKNNVRESVFRFQNAVYFTVNGNKHGWAPIQLQPQWERIL